MFCWAQCSFSRSSCQLWASVEFVVGNGSVLSFEPQVRKTLPVTRGTKLGERGKDSVFSFTLFCNDRSYWMQKNCTMLYKRDAWGLDHESYVISVCHTVFTLAWCDSLPAPLAQKLGQLHDFLVTLRTKGKGQNTISVQQVVVWGDGPVINKIST